MLNITEYIDQAINALNKLYGLPAAALVLASCLALGYVLRFIKKFPNGGIPVAVVFFGAIMMSLVADTRASNMTLRVWIVRNVLVGMVIGFGAWLIHNMVLSKIEDWIAAKFPDKVGDTTFFKAKPGDAPAPLPPRENPATVTPEQPKV